MNIMPAYRNTDSHPYQQNHMAFPHHNPPVMEGIPPQMNMNPSKSPSAYEQQTWPYIGGHSYPSPMQFCCGHHRSPGYWTSMPAYPHIPTSSYPHIPTSSPMCFSGGYPAYTEPCCVPYAPPPHYNMDLPRYEYDKCMPREYHCCGCPNHPLSHKEGTGVKIEEHEPEAGTKVNNTMSPSQLKNYPYPFVWMPPQFIDNKELKRPEVGDQHDRKPSEKVWNGWFPLDINSLANMMQDGNGRKGKNRLVDNGMREAQDGKTNPSQQSERNRREFPFPVVWIPNYNMQEGEKVKDHESDSSPNPVSKVPHAFINSTPVVSHRSDDASNRSNVNGNDLKVGGSDVTREETDEKIMPIKPMELQRSEPENHEKRVRDIPVKQIEGDVTEKEAQTNVKTESHEKGVRDIPVKQIEGDVTEEEAQTNAKRQSSSPKKTSKLPPVCLRVDPLPRKKNCSGSSRSPSPSKKGSAAASTNGTSKSSSSSSNHDKALEDAKHQRASDVGAELKPKEKTIEVVEMSGGKKDGEENDGSESHGKTQALQEDSNTAENLKPKKLEGHVDGTQSQVTSNSNTEVHKNSSTLTSMGESWTCGEKINGNEEESKVNDMLKEEATESTDATDAQGRKVFSDAEAAALIQAAYRGFQVRKWEPLEKLKQIAEVSKHVTEVRGSIEALEASSNKQIDERERIAIGETIMRLLLKLDTMQGLPPSFRELRKSLARELNSLQEKLDSLVAKISQLHLEDQSMRKLMTPPVGSNGECMQEQVEEEVSMLGKDSSDEGIIEESHVSSELQAEEIAASENSSDSIVHASQDMTEQNQDQLSIKNRNPIHDDEKLQSVALSLPADHVSNERPEQLPEETVNVALNKLSADEASGCDISELQPKTKSELEGIPNETDELDMKAWGELPLGVIDDLEADNIDFKKDKESEIEGEELQISDVTNTSGDNFAQDGESSQMHEMEELPIGLLDDDTTNSEKHQETGTSAQVLQSEGECNPAPITHSLADGNNTSKEAELDQQEQQQLEQEEENQRNGESDDWVKVEHEQDGLKGDATDNAKVEGGSREENDEQSVTIANEDACLEVKEVTINETPEEEVAVKEAQSEKVIKDDAENQEALYEHMGEQGVTSSLLGEVPLHKQGGERDTDKNLVEENEKLRKMMHKLLEVGNEQLTVISSLTERVKDLEKKLAKKKRARTKHGRPTTSKSSFKKSSNNNQLHDRITGVVM